MKTATVGIWVDGGSRYENERNNGVAHFLEHMVFKGTKKRSQYQLELEVENIGAHLNAYTSREQTVYFAKCFSSDLERAVEILADVLLNSRYGDREIKIERGVIVREMEEVEQNLQEVVFDHLHAGAFRGCSLARTILGPRENIETISREDLVGYVKTFYKGPRMVLASAGGVDHEHLVELGQKYFGGIEHGSEGVLEYEPGMFKQSYQVIEHGDMCYGCLAVEGTSWTHKDNIAMQLANTVIGQYDRTQGRGLGAASKLADEAALIQGVQSFMAFTTSYKDTGLSGIYFCCEETDLEKWTEKICESWHDLHENIDEEMLQRAKRTLFTNMLLLLDGSTPICEDIGRQLLCYGRRVPTNELESMINSVTTSSIKELMRKYFLNRPFAYTVVGGRRGWPTQDSVSRWLRLN